LPGFALSITQIACFAICPPESSVTMMRLFCGEGGVGVA
jgi:hypothetical protein